MAVVGGVIWVRAQRPMPLPTPSDTIVVSPLLRRRCGLCILPGTCCSGKCQRTSCGGTASGSRANTQCASRSRCRLAPVDGRRPVDSQSDDCDVNVDADVMDEEV